MKQKMRKIKHLAAGLAAVRCLQSGKCFQPSLTIPKWNHGRVKKSFASLSALQSLPRIKDEDLETLSNTGIVVCKDFIPPDLVSDLQRDVEDLRLKEKFKVAKVGQDSTNTLAENIRKAETCFIGPGKLSDRPNAARSNLYQILDKLRADLSSSTKLDTPPLDSNLSELLYAYYPNGGYYRRHRDAVPNSASILRSYSLLLYLNRDWTEQDAGYLRIHRDSGGDSLPPGEEPNYFDVQPQGGTLVLFRSHIPHEVLDTNSQRLAVVGWYNRPLTSSDIDSLSSDQDKIRGVMLIVSAALITVGLVSVFS